MRAAIPAAEKINMGANKLNLPPELRRKISSALYTMVAQQRTFLRYFGLGLSAISLYGPIAGPSDHNGIRYLVGPWVCPSLTALFRTVRPFRPYRAARFIGGTSDVDTKDPVVMRLVNIYRSDAARNYLWRQALKLSAILFVIMLIVSVPVRNSLNWSFPYSRYGSLPTSVSTNGFWLGLMGGALGSYIALMADYITWGLMTWATQESSR